MKLHIVRAGEAFEELVQKYNVPFERLLEANPTIEDYSVLEPGSKIRIPTGKVPVSIPQADQAEVEDLFLDPGVEKEPDLKREYDEFKYDDWELDDLDDDEFPMVAAGAYSPIFPMEEAYDPYYSISHFEPPMPFPIYPPMAPYPMPAPAPKPARYPITSRLMKKESSSTVY